MCDQFRPSRQCWPRSLIHAKQALRVVRALKNLIWQVLYLICCAHLLKLPLLDALCIRCWYMYSKTTQLAICTPSRVSDMAMNPHCIPSAAIISIMCRRLLPYSQVAWTLILTTWHIDCGCNPNWVGQVTNGLERWQGMQSLRWIYCIALLNLHAELDIHLQRSNFHQK